MKRCWFPLTGLLLASVFSLGWVAQRGYIKGTLVAIEQRTRDRVLLYQVDTPIMTEDAYLSVTITVNGMNYEGEYDPWRTKGPLPILWKAGDSVSVRMEKHFFYLKRLRQEKKPVSLIDPDPGISREFGGKKFCMV